MKKNLSISILSIITLCFTNMNCTCSECNNSKIEDNSFVSSESDLLQYKKHKIYRQQIESPHNTNSFLIEHGGDPIFSDDSLSIMPEDPMLLFQNNHNWTIQELTKITKSFVNENNYTLSLIKNTINELNNIFNNVNTDGNDVIIEQFKKYINKLEELNNKISNNKSLSIDKQQLIKSNQILDIINISKIALETIVRMKN